MPEHSSRYRRPRRPRRSMSPKRSKSPKAHRRSMSPKRSKAHKRSRSRSHSSNAMAPERKVMVGCERLTLKKYKSRPGPPYPGNQAGCRGLKMEGNDGVMYESVARKDGVYRWVKVKAPKAPKAPKARKRPVK